MGRGKIQWGAFTSRRWIHISLLTGHTKKSSTSGRSETSSLREHQAEDHSEWIPFPELKSLHERREASGVPKVFLRIARKSILFEQKT